MKIGIDLVHLPAFAEKLKNDAFVQRVFTDRELSGGLPSAEHAAGMFAAKEAYGKAMGNMPPWHDVEITHDRGGKPHIQAMGEAQDCISVSISHDGEYAAAMVLISDH